MSTPTLDYAPPPEFDVARFVARYLSVFAWVSLAAMLATILIRQQLAINANFALLFWAAAYIRRRSPTARFCTIAYGLLMMTLSVVIAAFAVFSGTKNLRIDLIVTLKNPPLWQALALCVAVFIVAAVPVALLLYRCGREQFAKPIHAADPSDVAALQQLAGDPPRPPAA